MPREYPVSAGYARFGSPRYAGAANGFRDRLPSRLVLRPHDWLLHQSNAIAKAQEEETVMVTIISKTSGVVGIFDNFTRAMQWLIAKATEYTAYDWHEGDADALIYLRTPSDMYWVQ